MAVIASNDSTVTEGAKAGQIAGHMGKLLTLSLLQQSIVGTEARHQTDPMDFEQDAPPKP